MVLCSGGWQASNSTHISSFRRNPGSLSTEHWALAGSLPYFAETHSSTLNLHNQKAKVRTVLHLALSVVTSPGRFTGKLKDARISFNFAGKLPVRLAGHHKPLDRPSPSLPPALCSLCSTTPHSERRSFKATALRRILHKQNPEA